MSKRQFGIVIFLYPMFPAEFSHYTVAVYDFDNQQVRFIKDPLYVPLPGVVPDVISFVDYFEEFNLISARKFKDFPEREVNEEELRAAMLILEFLQREKDSIRSQIDSPDNMEFNPDRTIEMIKSYIDTYIAAHQSGEIYKDIAEQCQSTYEKRKTKNYKPKN